MTTIAIIEARMTSRRFPGKVLRPFLDRPALGVLIDRLKRARTLDGIVVATTTNATDDPVAELAEAERVVLHRGSEEDVLGRVLGAARGSGADVIVEITGDCPFMDPDVVDLCVERYRDGYDFVANTVPESDEAYPTGMDVRIFSTERLAELEARTRDPRDREHVSVYFWEHPEEYRLGFVAAPPELRWPDLYIVLDEPSDYEMLRSVYEALHPTRPAFGLRDILDYLRQRPDLARRNVRPPTRPGGGLSAVIVGCGRIAGGFNEHSEALALTHVVAYRRLGIPVVGCCDQDAGRARAFASRWDVPRQGVRLEDVLAGERTLVSVCTPPAGQAAILRSAAAHPAVRGVLLEKPLGLSLADARGLDEQAREWGRPVLVNYFRAFTAFYRELEAEIRGGRWGRMRNVTVHYSGTPESHASHALERLVASFGAAQSVARLTGDDRAPTFAVTFADEVCAIFVPLPPRGYSVFELDLFGERGRLRVVDSERRVEAFVARPDAEFAGYATLEGAPVRLPEMTYEVIGAVEAALFAARAGHDASGVLGRALEVARTLEAAAGGVKLSGS